MIIQKLPAEYEISIQASHILPEVLCEITDNKKDSHMTVMAVLLIISL